MTLSGSGWNTNPQDVLWFCHVCCWSGWLKAGTYHACSPAHPGEVEKDG